MNTDWCPNAVSALVFQLCDIVKVGPIDPYAKVKQLRLEREREKAMRETELEMLQREKEAEHFKTWAEQEDNFHLHQAKLR